MAELNDGQREFLDTYKKRAFDKGYAGKDPLSGNLPDSLLDELDDYELTTEQFWSAVNEAYENGFELYESENPKYSAHIDAEERREAAMQAGMAFGCQGYNDVMGY